MEQQLQHLPIFSRWRCLTHDCGNYNFNNMIRHEIDSCDIISEETVGVVRPKSFGGFGGDTSRRYLQEYQDQVRDQQINESKVQRWLAWRAKELRRIYRYKRRFANQYKRIQQYQGKKNKNR